MSNLNLNKVVLCGRLTADPELKQTQNGIAVVSFSLAVNRRFTRGADGQGNSQADFINCVAWRQTAEFISRYFKKGSSLCITGSIQTRTWTDTQSGQKRYATEVMADEVTFTSSASNGAGAPAGSYTPEAYGTPSFSTGSANFEEIPNDESLPF